MSLGDAGDGCAMFCRPVQVRMSFFNVFYNNIFLYSCNYAYFLYLMSKSIPIFLHLYMAIQGGSRRCYVDEVRSWIWQKFFGKNRLQELSGIWQKKKRVGQLGTLGPWALWCQKRTVDSLQSTGAISQLLGWWIWNERKGIQYGSTSVSRREKWHVKTKNACVSKCEKKHSTKQHLHISLDVQFYQACFHGWNSLNSLWVSFSMP